MLDDPVLLDKSSFHNPRLSLDDPSKQRKIYELSNGFVLQRSKLEKIMELFMEEMRLGLVANPPRPSVFYMCNTFVTDTDGVPDGTEEGDILGMDLGGTNLRFYLARLKRGQEPEFRSEPYDVPLEYRSGSGVRLFDFLADCLKDFIEKQPDIRDKRLPFGFTFSFGYDQLALDKGVIKDFSIVTDLSDAVGRDAVELFRDSIARKGLHNVELLAMCNDTTATLAYGMYLRPGTKVAFVMGSGMNTCYLEKVSRIGKIDPIKCFGKPVDSVIINLENGFLGDNGSIDFAKTKFDLEIDETSWFPHVYGFEKLIGGVFIGDLVRRQLLDLAENNVFVNGVITDQLKQKDSIMGKDVSAVEADSTDSTVTQLLNRLGYTSEQISSDDIRVVKYICALISVRNTLLSAADIAAVVKHIGDPVVSIALDGSLYKHHPKISRLLPDFVHELIPNQRVETFLADGGSGKGSAFIAAVAAKRR